MRGILAHPTTTLPVYISNPIFAHEGCDRYEHVLFSFWKGSV